jgi:hypothetical protein
MVANLSLSLAPPGLKLGPNTRSISRPVCEANKIIHKAAQATAPLMASPITPSVVRKMPSHRATALKNTKAANKVGASSAASIAGNQAGRTAVENLVIGGRTALKAPATSTVATMK